MRRNMCCDHKTHMMTSVEEYPEWRNENFSFSLLALSCGHCYVHILIGLLIAF